MRIPLGEEEVGWWVPSPYDEFVKFVPLYQWVWGDRSIYRTSTFAEFKEYFPIQQGWRTTRRTNEKRRKYR